jgi:aromatic ring-cleaving dioxygenase
MTTTTTKATAAKPPRFPLQFRLPPPGQIDPWFSLNRSAWNALILPHAGNDFTPQVKSITTRQPGRKRGIRIVLFVSAKSYFDKLCAEQLEQPSARAA